MSEKIEVDPSDLLKIRDALKAAHEHQFWRDQSNASLHLARETRLSPLTSTLEAQLSRVEAILGEAGVPS